jgi:hypothetical protein
MIIYSFHRNSDIILSGTYSYFMKFSPQNTSWTFLQCPIQKEFPSYKNQWVLYSSPFKKWHLYLFSWKMTLRSSSTIAQHAWETNNYPLTNSLTNIISTQCFAHENLWSPHFQKAPILYTWIVRSRWTFSS